MSLKVENIKRLMGWCPNAKANESRRHVSFENFDSEVQDRAKGKYGDFKDLGWLRRVSTQILLLNIFLTFVYFLIINQIGLNLFSLLTGFFVVLSQFALRWNKQMQRYDDIARKPIVRQGSKKKYLPGLLIIIFFILFFVLPFTVLPYMFNFGVQPTYYGLSVVWFLIWGFYFQLIYWEKKYHMRIYIIFENGLEKMYAIGEKEGEF